MTTRRQALTGATDTPTLERMNLIAFHRVLIAVAIIFFAGYAAWEVSAWVRGGGSVHLALAAGSVLAVALLLLYLRRLRRFLRLPDNE